MAWIWPLSMSNTSIKWLSTKAMALEADTVQCIMTRKYLPIAEITFVKEYCRPRCPLSMLKEIPHHDHSKEISTLRKLSFWVSASVSDLWDIQDLCLLNNARQENTKGVSDSKWEIESNKSSFEIRQSLEIKEKNGKKIQGKNVLQKMWLALGMLQIFSSQDRVPKLGTLNESALGKGYQKADSRAQQRKELLAPGLKTSKFLCE